MTTDVWAAVLPDPAAVTWADDLHALFVEAEARRARADYDTGSILEAEARMLRAVSDHVSARTVIEVGTFIGTSTTALASAPSVTRVYTCDCSNDCLSASETIRTYPKRTSTDMLRELERACVVADLCFFDGVLNDFDVPLLLALTHHQTVLAFHDYNYGPKVRLGKKGRTYLETVPRKGIGNVRLLTPHLPEHSVIDPLPGTTLALMVPKDWL